MFDLMVLSVVAKERQNNLLEEVSKRKMLKAIRTARPRLRERLLARVGDLLISAGLRLQERYKPAIRPNPKAYRSGC